MADLQRFLNAQEDVIDDVYAELAKGKKQSHWMWFVFPQLTALGRSITARKYGIESLDEVKAYLSHPALRERLLKCTRLMLKHSNKPIRQILGSPDDLKFQSCMTLFREAAPDTPDFQKALDAFYAGLPDERTLVLLNC
jgi:uncharacterized protein (DUF1810 family)